MRNYLLIVLVSFVMTTEAQSSFNFLLVNYTQSDSITCRNPQLHYGVINLSTLTPITYSWASNSNTFVGTNFTVNAPGIYTVTATASNSTSLSKTFTVSSYTVSPSISITPSLQNISCTLTPLSHTLSCLNLTFNVSQRVLSPHGGAYVATQPNVIYEPGAPGVYTVVTTNTQNGCETSGSFTVTSNDPFPTFNLTSNQSFTLGCANKSITTVMPTNIITNPTPGAPLDFNLLPGSTLVNPPPYNFNTVGSRTIIIQDLNNGCIVKAPFTITSNTISPTLDSLIIPYSILNCEHPNTVLKGISKNSNVSYSWSYTNNIGIITTVLSNTIAVQTITSSPTKTIAGEFVFALTDNSNACRTSTQIAIFQNIFPPNAIIGSTETCVPPAIVLSNLSTTGIPATMPFPTIGVVADLWEGPTPQPTLQLSNTYTASTPGQYFLTALDKSNGCKSKTNVELSLCVSLPEQLNTSEDNFSVFPNPSSGSFLISFSHNENLQFTIEVLNLIGKTIQVHDFAKTSSNLNFSVENLPTGKYFVRATSGKNVVTKKVVVN